MALWASRTPLTSTARSMRRDAIAEVGGSPLTGMLREGAGDGGREELFFPPPVPAEWRKGNRAHAPAEEREGICENGTATLCAEHEMLSGFRWH